MSLNFCRECGTLFLSPNFAYRKSLATHCGGRVLLTFKMFFSYLRYFALYIIHQIGGFDIAGFAFIRLVSGNGLRS